MEESKISDNNDNKMCRLCLKTEVTMVDIFSYSSKMRGQIAELVMRCAPVQITKHDGLPNLICKFCYAQLKKIHKFQTKVLQSEKTLRRSLHRLQTIVDRSKSDCSNQQSSDESNDQNSIEEIPVKCEIAEGDGLYQLSASDESLICEVTEEPDVKDKTSKDSDKIETIWLDTSSISDDKTDVKEEPALSTETKTNKNSDSTDVDKVNSFIENMIDWKETETKISNTDSSSDTGNSCDGTEIKWNDSDGGNTKKLSSNKKSNKAERSNDKSTASNNKYSSQEQFQCETCKKCFSRLSSVKRHNLQHTGEKPYQCDICNRRFAHLGGLKTHKMLHTGEKPHQCDVCKKCFTQWSTLRTHKLVHTGEKPYQCDVCSKCFTQLGHFNEHYQHHGPVEPYRCEICCKSFAAPITLRRHMLLHTGEKLHECDVCKKCFTQSAHLNRHKLVHTR